MRNIIITGGELYNKGAQAMTFITVDEMKKRFPNHQVLVLSELDLQRPKVEQEQYAFRFIGWYPLKFAKCQNNSLLRALCLLRNKKELLEAEDIYKNADLMIDISGYALGSNWSTKTCEHYLEHLAFAKAFHIPIYLMPQSFGPFDFQGKDGEKIDRLISKLLPTAKVICAREQEGYQALKNRYHLNNVIITEDLVLNNRGVDAANVYRRIPELRLLQILPESVAVLPNQRNYAVIGEEKAQNLYCDAIRILLQNGLNVYLLSHSDVDQKICKQLKNEFTTDSRVTLIDQELSCMEFNEAVKQFQFIVASRFHSIVHAFKNAIPCVALGWATKYNDLMQQFEQGQYMMDVRQSISKNELENAIYSMMEQRDCQSTIIHNKLNELQERDIFEIIKL